MEKIVEWLISLDSTKLMTVAITALVVWVLSMIIIVVGVLKNKFNATSIKTLLEQAKLDNQQDILNNITNLKDEIVKILGNIQEDFIAKDAENTSKRLEAIKSLANDIETKSVELSDVSKETPGISKLLDSLEE